MALSSQTEQTAVDASLDLFDVHGESPSPSPSPSVSPQPQPIPIPIPPPLQTSLPAPVPHIDDQTNCNDSINIVKPSSDNNTTPQECKTSASTLANKSNPPLSNNASYSPVSSHTSSPQPPYANNKNLNMTLDKFSKEDLFKLFGKARKENRVLKRGNESLKAKNRDIYKALNASNRQNEVLQIGHQHLREEYNALQTRLSTANTDSLHKYDKLQEKLRLMQRTSEERISLIKTQSASYIDEINRLNEQIDVLSIDNENVQRKIGEQYTEFTVQINVLKQSMNALEKELTEKNKQNDINEHEIELIQQENSNYEAQIGTYKDIARKAETNLDRIESLEEELRDKIRENHQLQIKTRSLNQNIKKLTLKLEQQNVEMQALQHMQIQNNSDLEQLKSDNKTYKEDNGLLNEKLDILLKENADNTLKSERQIGSIENYHLSKYKTLLNSFQMMKKRIEANNKMNEMHDSNNNHRYSNIGYSNEGWKKYHGDITLNNRDLNKYKNNLTYSIDLELDDDEFNDNINDLNHNINAIKNTKSAGFVFDSDSNKVRKYENLCKEYKDIIHSLQKQLKRSVNMIESERETNKKFQAENKRLSKPKHINIDYLRNVLVKFLILSEYLTDEQVVLIPVLGSILKLSQSEKEMIDNSYNQNVYFMGANTLFPENANANYSPEKKKKRKKRKERDKKKDGNMTM